MSENVHRTGTVGSFWPASERIQDGSSVQARFAPLSEANIADALSEQNSRAILAACVDAPRSVKEMCQLTGLPVATAYRQVHRLLDLGVLIVERSALTAEGKKYDLFRSRIAEAHLDLTSGHEQVRWVANEATEGRLSGMWEAIRAQAARAP